MRYANFYAKKIAPKSDFFYNHSLSEHQAGNQVTDADGDKGGDEAGELEGMVDDIFADMRGAGSIKADSRYLRRVVRQEEIAVHRGEEGEQDMRRECSGQRVPECASGILTKNSRYTHVQREPKI